MLKTAWLKTTNEFGDYEAPPLEDPPSDRPNVGILWLHNARRPKDEPEVRWIYVSPDEVFVCARGTGEAREFRRLWKHLTDRNFTVTAVDDGGEVHPISTCDEAMSIVFNLDMSWVQVRGEYNPKPGEVQVTEHAIMIVLGNDPEGEEIVSDYSYKKGDPDGFNEVMEEFHRTFTGPSGS